MIEAVGCNPTHPGLIPGTPSLSVAQRIEQRVSTPRAAGSNPVRETGLAVLNYINYGNHTIFKRKLCSV